jgi:hypothetical protein
MLIGSEGTLPTSRAHRFPTQPISLVDQHSSSATAALLLGLSIFSRHFSLLYGIMGMNLWCSKCVHGAEHESDQQCCGEETHGYKDVTVRLEVTTYA